MSKRNTASPQVNLEKLADVSDLEFSKFFSKWLQEDDVARHLQAKLRKDLFENFNKTLIGRRISELHVNSQRIMLSPLILVLNTLVAEFLYDQNYHYTLSVFCTEIPYRHTLPNFEKSKNFRFLKTELDEIFEAIKSPSSFDIPKTLQDTIIDQYLKNKSKSGNSLLYYIFKNTFEQIKSEANEKKVQLQSKEKENNNIRLAVHGKSSSGKSVSSSKSCDSSIISRKDTSNLTSNIYPTNSVRYLNKYLILLSKKVKEMSQNVRYFEKPHHSNHNSHQRQPKKSLQNRKFEMLNKSLENISRNLRYFSVMKRKNRRISQITNALEKMSQQFEKCTRNIEMMSKRLPSADVISDKSNPVTLSQKSKKKEKTYYEWIDEMKTTKHGKKFLAKIEACLLKVVKKEKSKIMKEYKMELEAQKQMIETRYKEKLLQDLSKQSSKIEEIEKNRIENIEKAIEVKFKEFGFNDADTFRNRIKEKLKPSQEIQTETKEKQIILKDVIENDSKKEDIISLQKEILKKLSNQPPVQMALAEKTVGSPNICKFESTRTAATSEGIKQFQDNIMKCAENFNPPKLHEITRTIVEKERNIDQIIFDAKLRIQQLEYENNQLNKSFQKYLERHKTGKCKVDKNAASIWDNYKIGKTLLQKKCEAIKTTRNYENLRKQNELKINEKIIENQEEELLLISGINSPKTIESLKCKESSQPKFENPFRQLQKDLILKKKTFGVEPSLSIEVENSQEEDNITIDISKSSQKRIESCRSNFFTLEKTNFQIVEHNKSKGDEIVQVAQNENAEVGPVQNLGARRKLFNFSNSDAKNEDKMQIEGEQIKNQESELENVKSPHENVINMLTSATSAGQEDDDADEDGNK